MSRIWFYGGFDLRGWTDVFVAEVGASASLAGLLFVALSINLGRIVSYPKLPARAAETLASLALVLLVSTCGLLPESVGAFGIEVLVLAVPFVAVVGTVQRRHGPDSPTDPAWWFWSRVASVQAGAVVLVVAGATCLIGHGLGLWWVVPAVALAFGGALYNAWVLLVEIVRKGDPPHA